MLNVFSIKEHTESVTKCCLSGMATKNGAVYFTSYPVTLNFFLGVSGVKLGLSSLKLFQQSSLHGMGNFGHTHAVRSKFV